MALRIGKKKDKPGDDWSQSSLSDTGNAPSTPTPAVAPTTDPADSFATTPPPKKSLSPVLLAAGLVLLLTAAGVGAYFMFFNTPAEDTTVVATAPPAPEPMDPPADPAAPATAPPPVGAAETPPSTKATPKPVAVKPKLGAPTRKVAPGKAGLVPPKTTAPAVRPKTGKPPAAVPKPNQPTPVPIMPDGVAGQPGKGLRSAATVPAVQPAPPLTPALQAQLRTLWQQGAAAKWRGDYAAARRAWQRMLQLRPGHPGVQEAINKLPR